VATVLVVDDEARIRRILCVLLREAGHLPVEAASGEEALTVQAETGPAIILLDLRLPGMDGLEILPRLLAAEPRPDVLVMTAHGSIRSAVEAIRHGAFDFLSKPFDNAELMMLVQRALELRSLHLEVDALRGELDAGFGFDGIIGISPQMRHVFKLMAKVAPVDATVLVTGESGTGKELAARAVHRRSERAGGPFLAVNCGALPQTLIESEFFGHERGAFTGAREARPGSFEQASGGTLFLDEIGELPLESQAKLLRALQEGKVRRLGGRRELQVDVRVIAATNRDLEAAVRQGSFREDLYWRLNVVQVPLPPRRQRRQDLPLLIDHFLDRHARQLGLPVKAVDPAARELLASYDWPGNVRELENTLARAMILCDGDRLSAVDLPARVRGEPPAPSDYEDLDPSSTRLRDAVRRARERVERSLISARLVHFGGHRGDTAASLGISRKTLFNKIRAYDIDVGSTTHGPN